jgi:hypothetical protein
MIKMGKRFRTLATLVFSGIVASLAASYFFCWHDYTIRMRLDNGDYGLRCNKCLRPSPRTFGNIADVPYKPEQHKNARLVVMPPMIIQNPAFIKVTKQVHFESDTIQ